MLAKRIEVAAWSPSELCASYDFAFATAGYEARARHGVEVLSPKADVRVAWGFGIQEKLAFRENRDFFAGLGYDTRAVSTEVHAKVLRESLQQIPSAKNLKAFVDFSSLSRTRMAHVVWELANWAPEAEVLVDFVYSLAKFQIPPVRYTKNAEAGPVTPWFAGCWSEPERPLAAIVGLGYEEDKALGMVEHLQAPDVWTFCPISLEEQYDSALVQANEKLFELVPKERRLNYRLEQPLQTFFAVESLVDGLSSNVNTLLIPFGPKLFTIISLVVALRRREIPVWRVTAGALQEARDACPSGPTYGLRVSFLPTD